MDADPFGTLRRVAEIGYRIVETSPLAKMPVADFKRALDDLGLKNSSGHYMLPDLIARPDEHIQTARELGQEYMTVTVPWVADPSRFKGDPQLGEMGFFFAVLHGLTLDDWKWNAEQFNRIGEQTKKAGVQLAYHNHNFEFKSFGTTTGYDEFLRLTDPDLVKLELDCGWVTVAGYDPISYVTSYPDRVQLLHIKDFKQGFSPTTRLMDEGPAAPKCTELGRGSIDYRGVLAAAERCSIGALFVEQEAPFSDMPALEAIQVDYQHLKQLQA